MILVSLFDKKASIYQPPQAWPNLASCLRGYQTAIIQQPKINFAMFPEDYDIYQVGEFDEATGAVLSSVPSQYLESMINIVHLVNNRANSAGKAVANGKEAGA